MAEKGTVQAPLHAHEERDIHLRPVVYLGIGIALLVAGALLLTGWMLHALGGRETKQARQGAALAAVREPPPEPRLQVAPRGDLAALRAAEEEKLTTYGWVLKEAGVVRIPIERAMDLVAERGLPVRESENGRE